jgi:hypothetical protein
MVTGNCAAGKWELFAILAEYQGSRITLGWMFVWPKIQPPPKHAKEVVLTEWLAFFKTKWNLNMVDTTLTDKDWLEINAMAAVFPEAAPQLCYWHAIRAMTGRLSIIRRTPAPYDAASAQAESNFIDLMFVPQGQLSSTQVRGIWVLIFHFSFVTDPDLLIFS